ncbi:MAG: NifU family protein [Bacteroidetes bacterium]|nr:NifU family protein [Bacteroidota bacterium]MCL5738939.1 NifU family protein [Bacteroidota bacterium]
MNSGIMESREEVVEQIKEVLVEANKFLSIDNGRVEFVELESDGILRVKFFGSCAVCPLLPMTLRAGVERAVLLKIGEVKRVELATA